MFSANDQTISTADEIEVNAVNPIELKVSGYLGQKEIYSDELLITLLDPIDWKNSIIVDFLENPSIEIAVKENVSSTGKVKVRNA